jgi:Mlc titration factor MtfA (ptsG expression regulator)/transglutaminase-like putative cysteine protease
MKRLAEPQLHAMLWAAAAFTAGTALHADRIPLWATATALTCIAWRLLAAGGFLGVPVRSAKLVLALALSVAVYSQFRTLNGLSAGTALLVVMGSIKLLETREARDRGIVIGVALVLLLAACLDRQSLARTPLYLLHLWVCCTALAVTAHGGSSLTNRAAIVLAGRNLLLAVPLAFLLFTFFPRVPGSFWSLPQLSSAVTGLGDEMSPGSISKLTESDDPAFRVRFKGPAPAPEERYWRGPVLQDFDGYTWRRAPGRFYPQETLEYIGLPYVYRITMEPHASNWWFALERVRRAPDSRARLTYDYQLTGLEPVTSITTYEAISYTNTRSTAPLSKLARRYNTMWPAGRNMRSARMAQEMRGSVSSDAAYVNWVMAYFRKGGFEYTLTPPRTDFNSVDDLLFNTHKGFCGHYASAFVFLMRAANVPARVVTGYLGGEWNPVGGFFIVRQSEAHAWAEVWLDGRGWVRLDPTAVVAPERLRRGLYDLMPNAGSNTDRLMRGLTWLAGLRQNWEALNAWWDESVVRFDFDEQLDLLRALGIDEPSAQQLGWALAIGLVLWMLWVNRRIARRLRPAPPDDVARAYTRLCRKIARAGLAREPHQGPLAYAAALADFRPDVADIAAPLLGYYARIRYGGAAAHGFAHAVAQLRLPKGAQPFPPQWRAMLESEVPLYRRMPAQLRLRLEPLVRRFLERVDFVGCNGLEVTDEMRVTIAVQACLLIVHHKGHGYEDLHSVLLYPGEFVVTESEEDEAGVVTEGTRALSGQTFDTSRIVLSWSDVKESGAADGEAYNVVLHEFAHHLDHAIDSALSDRSSAPGDQDFERWHLVFAREYEALCDAVDRDEPTLIDPYATEHPAEFFAVATETFFELPRELRAQHPHLHAELVRYYGLDPADWT